MPELPEVETVANGVHSRTQGRRILSVWTSGKPQTFKSSEAEITEQLTGAAILGVRRVGKSIVITLRSAEALHSEILATRFESLPPEVDQGHNGSAPWAQNGDAEFLVHLGMTGRLLVSASEVPLPAHTHAVLSLDDGRELRFVDPRRFGRLSVRRTAYRGPGEEPLTISAANFAAKFRSRKTPIKAALLNQSILTGVGNIYADEALARAGIRPRRPAARLTRTELARLYTALQDVLQRAIALGGSSVSDYVDADGVRGFFQLEHLVYGRAGEPCRTCSLPIRRIIVGGRGTHFCPGCQR